MELHARRAPSADANNDAGATMRQTGQTRLTPMRSNACEALSLRCSIVVDRLVLGENVKDPGLLLEDIHGGVHVLLGDAVVDL